MTSDELATGLGDRSIFEQFWCVFMDNIGNDCLTDADTQDGFWTSVYRQMAYEAGLDTSDVDPLWFNAQVHGLSSYADVTTKFHSQHKLWLEPNTDTDTCDFTSTPTEYFATIAGEWKRCHNDNFNAAAKDDAFI